jgi:hypothetical protein
MSRRRLFQLILIGAALLTARATAAQPLKGPCDATLEKSLPEPLVTLARHFYQ